MTYDFKGHVKIVGIYMVKFNVSILNRFKIMSFFVNAKYIYKYNVILNKTVTKLFGILTKCFFAYVNSTSYLKEKRTFESGNTKKIPSTFLVHLNLICWKMSEQMLYCKHTANLWYYVLLWRFLRKNYLKQPCLLSQIYKIFYQLRELIPDCSDETKRKSKFVFYIDLYWNLFIKINTF